MSFGRRLKFLRRRDGLPVGKIAEMIGVPKEMLRDMEAGRRPPTKDIIHVLASHFDVKPGYFELRERRHAPAPEAAVRRPRAAASGRWRKRRLGRDLSARDFSFFKESSEPTPPPVVDEKQEFRPAREAPPTPQRSRPPKTLRGADRAELANAAPVPAPTRAPAPPVPGDAETALTELLQDADPRALLRALVEVLVKNDLCSGDDIADALERYE